ncbi:MAG: CARDB domain-containing protein [Candidatus Paceibacterota bacterium]
MENNNSNEKSQAFKRTLVRSFAILIMAVIIIFGCLAIVRIVPIVFNSISGASTSLSSFFGSKEKITLSVEPNQIKSGEVFSLSFTHSNKNKDGDYYLSYGCKNGVRLENPSLSKNALFCNTPIKLGNLISNKISLKGFSVKENSEIPLTLSFIPQGENKTSVSKDISITILKGNGVNVSSKQNTSTTAHNSGPANLSVRILNTGVIDQYTNQFVARSFNNTDKAAIQFIVENSGGEPTGIWSFKATLPSNIGQTYESPTEPSLAPGDGIRFTLGFNGIVDQNPAVVTITINSDNAGANKTATAVLIRNSSNNTVITNNYYSDLSIRILDTGTINRYTEQYTSNSYITSSDKAAVRFEVSNLGGQNTGTWKFNANIPTSNNQTYSSSYQNSMAPGEKRTVIFGFDNLIKGSSNIYINLNPDNTVNETNRSNNSAQTTLFVY